MITSSKTARARSTMSMCPFVIGSKDPGNTATERLRSLNSGLARVETQAMVTDPDLTGATQATYSLRERPLVEMLGHQHAALVQQARGVGLGHHGLVEVGLVGRVQVDHVEALAAPGEGRQRDARVLAEHPQLAALALEKIGRASGREQG